MVVSGVRSSWLASVMKRRIRSSDIRACSAEDSDEAIACWIWASMPLRATDNLPTSVRGSRCGTRRSSSPAAIAAAVCSTSASGRRLRCTTQYPTTPSTTRTAVPIATCDQANDRTVRSTSDRSMATVVSSPLGPRTDTARH